MSGRCHMAGCDDAYDAACALCRRHLGLTPKDLRDRLNRAHCEYRRAAWSMPGSIRLETAKAEFERALSNVIDWWNGESAK